MMKIDIEGITSNVKPPLKQSITCLDSAKKIISSINIPSDFSYASALRETIYKINSSTTKINDLSKWVTEAVQKYNEAENKNKSILDSLFGGIISDGIDAVNATISGAKKTLSGIADAASDAASDAVSETISMFKTGAKVAKKYVSSVANKIKSDIKATKSKISKGFKFIVKKAKEKTKKFVKNIQKLASNAMTGINCVGTKIAKKYNSAVKKAWNKTKGIRKEIVKQTKSVVADTGNVVLSLIKGLGNFAEGLGDAALIIQTAITTPKTAIVDAITYGISKLNGTSDNWKSVTSAMWKKTMSYVAEQHVDNAFKFIYKNTSVGKWLDKNAHSPFKSDGVVSEVLEGIGYVAGVAVLALCTGGTSLAVSGIAGMASFGNSAGEFWANEKNSSWKGINEMYKNGEISKKDYQAMKKIRNMTDAEWKKIEKMHKEGKIDDKTYQTLLKIRKMPNDWTTMKNLKNGLFYASANAAWEAAQYYVGSKLGGWTGSSKLITSATRVGTDTLFNGGDTFFRTLINYATSDKTLKQAWDEQGGWSSVASSIAVGLIASSIGEVKENLELGNKKKINTLMDVSDLNKKNLIKDIVDDIPVDLDDTAKAREIYLKLNQSVSYSDEYLAMNSYDKAKYTKELSDIYNKQVDIENMPTNSSVVCSNWAKMYKELLEESGISSENIEVIRREKMGSHNYVKIDLGNGKIILADATNNISGHTDLVNTKINNKTSGFIITTQEEFDRAKSSGKGVKNIFQTLNDEKNSESLSKIDDKIGYSTEQYAKDIDDIVNYYKDADNNKVSTKDKVTSYKNLYDQEKYGATEWYTISKDFDKNIFGKNTETHLYSKDKQAICVTEFTDDKGNKQYLYKINNSEIKQISDIDKIIKGAKQLA